MLWCQLRIWFTSSCSSGLELPWKLPWSMQCSPLLHIDCSHICRPANTHMAAFWYFSPALTCLKFVLPLWSLQHLVLTINTHFYWIYIALMENLIHFKARGWQLHIWPHQLYPANPLPDHLADFNWDKTYFNFSLVWSFSWVPQTHGVQYSRLSSYRIYVGNGIFLSFQVKLWCKILHEDLVWSWRFFV